MKTLYLAIIAILVVLLYVAIGKLAFAQVGQPWIMGLDSPLKQFKSGTKAENVKCQPFYFVPVIKLEDKSPACIKPATLKILIERGWAMKEKRYHLYFPGSAPPIIDTRIAKIVSSTPEAESIVGYSVGIPSYLPVGYSIQSILVDNSNSSKFVKILVANFPVTQNTTSVEFMDKGGIMIYIEPTSPAFNQTNWTAGWLNQTLGSMPIKIAGYDGVINDITKGKRFDEDIDIPAELAVFRNGSMIEISGFVHSLELIKIAEGISIVETSDLSTHYCGKFYTVPENKTYLNTVPVLLMKSNSTACARLTFTINSNYKDCNGPNCQHIFSLASMLSIRNLHYEKNDGSFSITPGKDYTNSFKIIAVPDTVDLANYPLGANFTATYIISPMPNATGFYDQSIPRLVCERYPLAVGYAASQVNASNFSYIDPLNPLCVSGGAYMLTKVEVSGMDYKEVTLRLAVLG